jgi:peptide-methionine (S)-S-oxide reductase
MKSRCLPLELALAALIAFVGAAPDDEKAATNSNDMPAAKKTPALGADRAKTTPASERQTSPPRKSKTEKATFGAGCFWHVEDTFEHVKGVISAVSGYAGGTVPYPTYEMVHTGLTGHAEVVQVEYDPEVVSYEKLLKVFWSSHDPTSINMQGEDEGPQYRSVIFYHNYEQEEAARKSYEALTRARVFRRPIVTELVPMREFYRAEDYHQDYYGGKPRTTSRRHQTNKTKTAKGRSKAANSSRGVKSPPASHPAPESPS